MVVEVSVVMGMTVVMEVTFTGVREVTVVMGLTLVMEVTVTEVMVVV